MNSLLQNRLKQINELYVKEYKAIQKQYRQFKLAFQNITIQAKSLQNYVEKSMSLNLLHVAFVKNFINILPKNCVIQVITNMGSLLQDQGKKFKYLVKKEQQKRQRVFDGSNIIKTKNMCQKCGQNVRKINIQQIKTNIQHQYLGLMQRMMKEINLQINDSLFTQEEDSQFFKKLHQVIKRKQLNISSNVSSIQELIALIQLQIIKVTKFKQDYNSQSEQLKKPNDHLIKNIQSSLTNLLNQSFKSKIPGFVNKMFKIYQKIYKKLLQKPKQQIQVQTQKWQSEQVKILNQKIIKINGLCFKQQNDINWLESQLKEEKKHLLKKQKQWIESYQKLNLQNLNKQAQIKSLNTKTQQYKDQIIQRQNKISYLKRKSKVKLRQDQREKQIDNNLKEPSQSIQNQALQATQQQQLQNKQYNRQTKRKKTLKSKKVIQQKFTKNVHQNISSLNDLLTQQQLKNQDQIIQFENHKKNKIVKLASRQASNQFNQIQNRQSITQNIEHSQTYHANLPNQRKQDQNYEMKQSLSSSSIESDQGDEQKYELNHNQQIKHQMMKSGRSQNYFQVAKVSQLLEQKVSKQKQNINIWKDSKQKLTPKNQINLFSQQTILSKAQLNEKNKGKTPRISMVTSKIIQQQILIKQNKTSQVFNNLKFDSQKRLFNKTKQQKEIKIQTKNIINRKKKWSSKEIQTELFRQQTLNLINIKKLACWLKQKFNLKINNQDTFNQNLQQDLQKIISSQFSLNIHNSISLQKSIDINSQNKQQIVNKGAKILPLVCQGYKKNQTNKINYQQNNLILKAKIQQKNIYSQLRKNKRNSEIFSNISNKGQHQINGDKRKKHQHHRSQPTSTHQDRFQQQLFQNQICQFIKQQDITLFINQQTAYLYQCGHKKNYHKVGFSKLSLDQTLLFESLFHMFEQIKVYNKLLYQEFISFIRYPYQTMKNNYSGISMIKNMNFQSFMSFFQKIMYLHRKCSIESGFKNNICSHLINFVQKVKLMLNESIKAWGTESLKKQIQKQNQCEIFKKEEKGQKIKQLGKILNSQKSMKLINLKTKSNNISRGKRFETQSKKIIYQK